MLLKYLDVAYFSNYLYSLPMNPPLNRHYYPQSLNFDRQSIYPPNSKVNYVASYYKLFKKLKNNSLKENFGSTQRLPS